MARRTIDRRRIAVMAGASLLCGGRAAAAVIEMARASRLTPLEDQPYLPPTSLSMVADIYRRMTAPIRVNGAGPYPFVVDTGANQSVVSRELADLLGLPRGEPEPLHGVAGVEIAPTTRARLDVGGREQKDVVLSVLPAAAIGGSGMLGLDRLEGQELTLDFRGQVLRIKTGGRLWRDPADIAVKARRRDGQLTLVDADLAGIKLVAFLDSGAQNTIGNMALRALAVTRNPTSRWSETPIVSATGQSMMAEIADLPDLRIGGMRLPNWPVAFVDLHTFRLWNLIDRPAILMGVDVLSRFESVCLDFARDEVRFRLPS
ncbi:MAG: aspartyl protease family protein [Caulobacteraceae bacterium]